MPPAFMSQMFTDQLLLARHRGNGREPREERQEKNKQEEAEIISDVSTFHGGNETG